MILFMSWEFTKFMLFFSLILTIYAVVGTLLFDEVNSHYSDFFSSLITLVSSALGGFDFTILDSSDKGTVVPDLYLISFLVITYILALNLLIAILSNTYNDLSVRANILFLSEVLKLRSTLEYDKDYGAMVSTFPPWNVLILPSIPFYITKKHTYSMNQTLFYVDYVPVLFISSALYMGVTFALLPLAWLRGILLHFGYLFNAKLKHPTSRKALQLIIFCFLGPFILSINNMVDFYYYLRHLHSNKLLKKENYETPFAVSKENIRHVKNTI